MGSRLQRPVVAANFAVTWDGRITTRRRTPVDFSSAADKRRLLEIRAGADALLFGSRTVAVEGLSMGLPAADLREARVARHRPAHPARVLVSASGRVDPGWKFFQARFSPVIVYSTPRMPEGTRAALAGLKHVRVHCWETVDLDRMLRHLRAEYRVRRVVCEGGAQLFRSLVARDLLDQLYLTWCPRIFGGKTAPSITGEPGEFLPHGVRLKLSGMKVVENECFTHYRVQRPAS